MADEIDFNTYCVTVWDNLSNTSAYYCFDEDCALDYAIKNIRTFPHKKLDDAEKSALKRSTEQTLINNKTASFFNIDIEQRSYSMTVDDKGKLKTKIGY